MVQKNIGVKAIKFILKDIVLDVLYWPLWWYSYGLIEAIYRLGVTIKQGNQELALTIWLKNILIPMYGDYSWQGRLISLFMRVVQIIGRSLLFFLWILLSIIFFLIWIILPVFILYQILFNLGWLS